MKRMFLQHNFLIGVRVSGLLVVLNYPALLRSLKLCLSLDALSILLKYLPILSLSVGRPLRLYLANWSFAILL